MRRKSKNFRRAIAAQSVRLPPVHSIQPSLLSKFMAKTYEVSFMDLLVARWILVSLKELPKMITVHLNLITKIYLTNIPLSMLKLLVNPMYVMTCLGACMELIIVSGFIVFLPKYLETQFSLSNIQASIFTGELQFSNAYCPQTAICC